MEHLENKITTRCEKMDNGLNKSKRIHRLQAYIAKKTQPVLMEKLYSVIAHCKRLLMDKAQPINRSVFTSQTKGVPLEKNIANYIGIDVAAETFTVSIFRSPETQVITKGPLSNSAEGFSSLIEWLRTQQATPSTSIVCMEATGVYGETLTHYLCAQGFSAAVEPPLKVKRAFNPSGHKTDAVDSAQIAEYAYRFFDELKVWQPKQEYLEELKHFLTAREQLVKESVSVQNALKAYRRHFIQSSELIGLHEKHLIQLKEHIAVIDARIASLIQQQPSLHQLSLFLVSLCGVGILLSAYMLIITNAFESITNYKTFAAFVGICPYKFESGSSVYRPAQCRQFGSMYAKKLLHLAARSVATHHPEFRKYYFRKLEEGKDKSVALNNIANKLVKICFALTRDKQYYIKGYHCVNPLVLQNA